MSALDLPDAVVDPLPEDLVEVGTYASIAEGEEHGLVVLALGRAYWLLPAPNGGFRLIVERDASALVQRHLAAYARERRSWPPPPIVDPWSKRETDIITPLLWVASILAIYRYFPEGRSAGSLDASAVFDRGEIWRAATALFFHADAAHVLSNALGGLLVFTALISTLGRLRAWLLVVLASIAGNLATAAINYPAPYRSLGSSTAVFAGVGLLTGRALRVVARARHPHRWRAIFAPLAAGLTVLALHGVGAAHAHVDVGAHLCGFLAGIALGFVAGLPASGPDRATASKTF